MKPIHLLSHIKLQLARSKEFPSGSARRGYDIVAPLDPEGQIDPAQWKDVRAACRVRRLWDDEEEVGHLVHKPGGAEHARWTFVYDGDQAEDTEEAGYRFGAHKFRPGEYVSIRGQDGELHTFVAASVEPLPVHA